MDEIIKGFLGDVKVGAKQVHRNMTLYCLLIARDSGVDFLTLDEALEQGAISITEVDQSGSVPELKVTNKSDRKVLMLDGEELVGAKQNRVLNVTVLIAAHSDTVIPVSCVEQGRWSYRSQEFGSARRAMSADLKKKKARSVRESLRTAGSFASAQGMVWNEISAKFARMDAEPSATMALSDLYESHEELAQDYLKAFHPVDHQIGIAVFIDGELAGIELLDKFETFKKSHSKLVQSYVMDALETASSESALKNKPSKTTAAKVLEFAATAAVEKRQSVALGQDLRVETGDIVGAGLEFEGRVLQLTLFQKDDGDTSGVSKSSMSRASRRRDSIVR